MQYKHANSLLIFHHLNLLISIFVLWSSPYLNIKIRHVYSWLITCIWENVENVDILETIIQIYKNKRGNSTFIWFNVHIMLIQLELISLKMTLNSDWIKIFSWLISFSHKESTSF